MLTGHWLEALEALAKEKGSDMYFLPRNLVSWINGDSGEDCINLGMIECFPTSAEKGMHIPTSLYWIVFADPCHLACYLAWAAYHHREGLG